MFIMLSSAYLKLVQALHHIFKLLVIKADPNEWRLYSTPYLHTKGHIANHAIKRLFYYILVRFGTNWAEKLHLGKFLIIEQVHIPQKMRMT